MKKRIFILGISILAIVGSIWAGVTVTTSCGRKVMTVGPEYFQGSQTEFYNYLQQLNKIYCGKEGPVSWESDSPVTLIP